jgi:hypothetical protein
MKVTNHTSAFFFITSNGKFLRIDLHQLVCGISRGDHAHLHTETDFSQPALTHEQMKSLLNGNWFIWINDRIALSRYYAGKY